MAALNLEHFDAPFVEPTTVDEARVRIHNQNMTTAAKSHAERKTFGHLS